MAIDDFYLSEKDKEMYKIVHSEKLLFENQYINFRHFGGNIYLGSIVQDDKEKIIKIYTSFYNLRNNLDDLLKIIDREL